MYERFSDVESAASHLHNRADRGAAHTRLSRAAPY